VLDRINAIIADYIKANIGAETYDAYTQQMALEDELDESMSPESADALRVMRQREIAKRAVANAMSYLDGGYDQVAARDLGMQDAVLSVVGEMISDAGEVYLGSADTIRSRIATSFSERITNGFRLDSLGSRIVVSRAVGEDREIRITYEPKDGKVERCAFYLSTIPYLFRDGVPRRIDINLEETSNRVDDVDIIQLEGEVVTALRMVIAEFS
jgi:hypothetical protein